MLKTWLSDLLVASIVVLGVSACGGGDDDEGVDAGSGGGVDASPSCLVPEALGSFEPLDGAQALHFTQDADPAVRLLSVASNLSDSRVDLLLIELWDGFGAFAGGEIESGEFEIVEDETAIVSCGVCVRLLANVQQDGSGGLLVEKQFIATAGTVNVESIGTREANEITGNYAGSVGGLTLSEIDADSEDGSALPGGCETGIESATWDAVIANGDNPSTAR